MDEAELIGAAQSGDREAFDELVRRTFVDTFTLARRLTGNEEDARDVVQDAYLRAWQGHREVPRRGRVLDVDVPHHRQRAPPRTRRKRAPPARPSPLDDDRRARRHRAPSSQPAARGRVGRGARPDRARRSTSCPPKLRTRRRAEGRLRPVARGDRRRARHLGRRRRRCGCTGPAASCATCCTTKEPKPMRCDEVTALLPGAGRRRSPTSTSRSSATSRRACAARPSSPATAACCARLALLRTRYVEPTPGLLGETLAALDRRRRARRASARSLSGRRLAYAGAIGGTAVAAGATAACSSPGPRTPPSALAGCAELTPASGRAPGVRSRSRCYPRRPGPRARRAVAQLAEHRSPKPAVGGSSPSCPARVPTPDTCCPAASPRRRP